MAWMKMKPSYTLTLDGNGEPDPYATCQARVSCSWHVTASHLQPEGPIKYDVVPEELKCWLREELLSSHDTCESFKVFWI